MAGRCRASSPPFKPSVIGKRGRLEVRPRPCQLPPSDRTLQSGMSPGRDRGSSIRASVLALIPGLLAAAAVLAVSGSTLRLEPGTAAWSRLVGGVGADGLLRQRSLVLLPGLPPGSWHLALEAEA